MRCDRLRCSRCSSTVLRVPGARWLAGLDYQALRSDFPDLREHRLGRFLAPTRGSAAYACQCSSHSLLGWLQITPQATPNLRWYCPGHADGTGERGAGL